MVRKKEGTNIIPARERKLFKEALFIDVWDKIGTWSFVFPERKRKGYVSDDECWRENCESS